MKKFIKKIIIKKMNGNGFRMSTVKCVEGRETYFKKNVTFKSATFRKSGETFLIISDIPCLLCETPGTLSYDDKSLCLECIFDSVFQHHARVQWIQNCGDPVNNLRKEVDTLREEIERLKDAINKDKKE